MSAVMVPMGNGFVRADRVLAIVPVGTVVIVYLGDAATVTVTVKPGFTPGEVAAELVTRVEAALED